MYFVQKRKSANSQWHTVKDQRGRKQGSDDLKKISLKVDDLRISFPRYDFRIVDNATGFVVPEVS